MGLALAYVGSHREDLLAYLLPHVTDDTITMEISSLAALALRFIFVGSKHDEVSESILQAFMEKYERGDKLLDEKWAKFMALGLGLLYLGEVTICNNNVQLLTALQDFRMLLMQPLRH